MASLKWLDTGVTMATARTASSSMISIGSKQVFRPGNVVCAAFRLLSSRSQTAASVAPGTA